MSLVREARRMNPGASWTLIQIQFYIKFCVYLQISFASSAEKLSRKDHRHQVRKAEGPQTCDAICILLLWKRIWEGLPGTRNYANTSGLQVEKLIVVEIRKFQSPKDPGDSCKNHDAISPRKRVRGEDEKLHASARMVPYLDGEPTTVKSFAIIPNNFPVRCLLTPREAEKKTSS